MTLAPIPTFMFCGKTQEEKVARMDSLPFIQLLTGFFNSMIWFAYALKIWNKDILYNNGFGKRLSRELHSNN